ncbi:MAG: hypothetical protein HQ530_02790 [Parcubacteria group bacterium]|nr:hypothetical protein [Parcubacteria group bacterium]
MANPVDLEELVGIVKELLRGELTEGDSPVTTDHTKSLEENAGIFVAVMLLVGSEASMPSREIAERAGTMFLDFLKALDAGTDPVVAEQQFRQQWSADPPF